MKIRILILLLILSSSNAIAQKLQLEKASPFTAVKWEKEQPIVQFNNDWYVFEALDHLSKKEVLNFCKKTYGNKWQKRFSEDLVEVLKGLNYMPEKQVKLKLANRGISNEYIGTFSSENRLSCLNYNLGVLSKNEKNLSRKQLKPGGIAPNFVAKDIKGNLISLYDFKGKLIYIDVWATWCSPCVKEMPYLKEIKHHFKDNSDVVIMSVSTDKDKAKWERFVKNNKLSGVHLRVEGKHSENMQRAYGIYGLPTFLLIGKDGKVITESATRPSEKDTLIKLINKNI